MTYRCVISLSIASNISTSAFLVAKSLIELLSQTEKIASGKSLKVAVVVHKSGMIDFIISDRELAIWLNLLIANVQFNGYFGLQKKLQKNSKNQIKIFPIQYIYNRCFSLLNLAEKEQIIILKIVNNYKMQWHSQQLPFATSLLSCSQEYKLIRQIFSIMDLLATEKPYQQKHWNKFVNELSADWLQFRAKCQIYGASQQHNPSLSVARLGLIFLLGSCLGQILATELN